MFGVFDGGASGSDDDAAVWRRFRDPPELIGPRSRSTMNVNLDVRS